MEQSNRAMGELSPELMHPALNPGPVLHPARHWEKGLAQPPPHLLKGIEPGGRGRQPDRLDSGLNLQGRQDVGVRMNVPIVVADVNQVSRRGRTLEVGIELNHVLTSHEVALKVVHLPGQGSERAAGAPVLIVARSLRARTLYSFQG
jgi:hypothetical protein